MSAVGMHPLTRSPKAKRACVSRVVQDPEHSRVFEIAPENLALTRTSIHAPRELKLLLAEGLHGRRGGAGAPEGSKEKSHAVLDAHVGIEAYAFVRVVDESDR